MHVIAGTLVCLTIHICAINSQLFTLTFTYVHTHTFGFACVSIIYLIALPDCLLVYLAVGRLIGQSVGRSVCRSVKLSVQLSDNYSPVCFCLLHLPSLSPPKKSLIICHLTKHIIPVSHEIGYTSTPVTKKGEYHVTE